MNDRDRPAITARGVSKSFGEVAAVEDVDLAVHQGDLFGLVGPSGCGKTTLARLIVGLLRPDEGELLVAGQEPAIFGPGERQRLGYLPQEFSLFPALSVLGNCRFAAGLYGIGWLARRRRIREVLDLLELWDVRGRRAAHISGGMKRRLSLACAILHEPSVLVVDEPTAGLDPTLRLKIWDYLLQLQARGTTIVLTTQYIEEADRCDSVGVMRAGRLIARGAPDELRRDAALPQVVEFRVDGIEPRDLRRLWDVEGVLDVRRLSGARLRVGVSDADTVLTRIRDALPGWPLQAAETREASFEEVFLALVERDEARHEDSGADASAPGAPVKTG